MTTRWIGMIVRAIAASARSPWLPDPSRCLYMPPGIRRMRLVDGGGARRQPQVRANGPYLDS